MMRLKTSATLLLWFFLPGAGAAFAATAQELIPAQMAQPAPASIIKILLLLTFFIHIVLVNIVLGSSLIATINAWRARPFAGYSLKGDSGFATGALALAVNFGVASFLFAQVAYGGFIYTGIVLMAGWWLAVPLLVMLAYYALYIIKGTGPGSLAGGPRIIMTANTILLMLVAFLLVCHSSLSVRPEAWAGWLTNPGSTMMNLAEPSLVPRYLHILAASLAVGGLFMALRSHWYLRRPGADKAEAAARASYGLNTFIYASLVQALAGGWYLFSLPAELRFIFLGGSASATLALFLAVLALIAALVAARRGRARLASGLTLGIIFIMLLLREYLRSAELAPYGNQAAELALTLPHGQGFAFAVFALCVGLGAALIFWMLRVAVKTFNGAGE